VPSHSETWAKEIPTAGKLSYLSSFQKYLSILETFYIFSSSPRRILMKDADNPNSNFNLTYTLWYEPEHEDVNNIGIAHIMNRVVTFRKALLKIYDEEYQVQHPLYALMIQ